MDFGKRVEDRVGKGSAGHAAKATLEPVSRSKDFKDFEDFLDFSENKNGIKHAQCA